MSATAQYATDVAGEPMELLRTMLEEQFAVHTNRLTELTVYGRLPGHGGHDPDELHMLAAHARQGIADTAQALRRMTEGTYGICEDCRKPIPLGRLRSQPHARQCVRCQRRRPR
jgi:DnaK suppressor protein